MVASDTVTLTGFAATNGYDFSTSTTAGNRRSASPATKGVLTLGLPSHWKKFQRTRSPFRKASLLSSDNEDEKSIEASKNAKSFDFVSFHHKNAVTREKN